MFESRRTALQNKSLNSTIDKLVCACQCFEIIWQSTAKMVNRGVALSGLIELTSHLRSHFVKIKKKHFFIKKKLFLRAVFHFRIPHHLTHTWHLTGGFEEAS